MTLNQILKKKKNKKSNVSSVIKNKPQIKGIILKLYTMTPKKPNSGLRKVAKIKINISPNKYLTDSSKGYLNLSSTVIAYIPKERHTLTVHNVVLIIPSKKKDLPGVKYRVLRNTLDCK